jgi:hypothetical protein
MTGTDKPTLMADYNVHVQSCEKLRSYSLLIFMTADVNSVQVGSYGDWHKLSYISLHKLWLRNSVRSCSNQSGLLIITHGARQLFELTPPTKRSQIINTAYGKPNQLFLELKIILCDSLKQIYVNETNSCINVLLQPAFAVGIATRRLGWQEMFAIVTNYPTNRVKNEKN